MKLFMAINLCRNDPRSFTIAVNNVADKHPKCKNKEVKELITFLNACERLPPLYFDDDAN